MSSNPIALTESTVPFVLLIDVKEVARRLDLSERTVWRLNSAGKLPKPVSIGGKSKRWRAEEIIAWVAAGCPLRATWEAMTKKKAA
jgi:predicted DNA-binding transcriptional regulator AlpA